MQKNLSLKRATKTCESSSNIMLQNELKREVARLSPTLKPVLQQVSSVNDNL